LKKWIINDFDFNSKVIAKSMEDTSSWHFWWVSCNLIIVIL
jgi:hypothetical protein